MLHMDDSVQMLLQSFNDCYRATHFICFILAFIRTEINETMYSDSSDSVNTVTLLQNMPIGKSREIRVGGGGGTEIKWPTLMMINY
jgi:hypothetical protein